MKVKDRFSIFLIGAFLAASTVVADDSETRQDTRAIDVLKSTSIALVRVDRVVTFATDCELQKPHEMTTKADEDMPGVNSRLCVAKLTLKF